MKRFSRLGCGLAVLAWSAVAGQWNVDPAHSSASFAVKHMMVSTVHGSFSGLKGSVDYDSASPDQSKVTLTVDTSTVSTRDDSRDKHLKSPDFFDVEKFPTMTFVSKKLVAKGPGKFQLIGDFTLHGVTKEVTFDVEGPTAPTKDGKGNLHVGASATTKINRKDYGLVWNRPIEAGGVVVGEDVDVLVEVELVQAKTAS